MKSMFTTICGRLFPLCMLFVATSSLLANSYVPTTVTDHPIAGAGVTVNNNTGVITGGTGNGTITLRSALKAADTLGGTHTVTLSTGTYTLTQTSPERQITIGNTSQNITINGNGPTNTIISMGASGKDRILFINPTGTTNSPVITVQGIRFQNGYLSSDPYGGAAICAGGGSAESLTVTNCAFDNNILPAGAYGGAAVCMQVRGNLTISNSTFTNNVSNDADGGAVLFIIFGTGLGTPYGTCSVTNSLFSGNAVHIPGATGSNGGALAISAQGGSTPFSATITGNTFLNNNADGYGGAISANNSAASATFNINFNRFVGNAILGDPTFPADSAPTNAMLFVNSAGSVNANNNWWASSVGPGATGVQRASGIGASAGGVFTANRWLQLKTTGWTNPIVTNQSSSLTASFLSNNLNDVISISNLATLIGLPVTWSGIGGTVTSQQTTVQAAGTATATYKETTGVAGTHSATAVVDGGPASGSANTFTFTVNKANATTVINSDSPDPTVTGQPFSTTYSVTGASGNSPTVPTGNVQVSDGVSSGTGTVAAGSATVALFTAGNRTLTATYQGDANFNASPASTGAAHLVNKADTTITITSDTPDPSNPGQAVSVGYSVSVTSPGAGTPTGNVNVTDGVDSASGTVASGSASLTLNTSGDRTLTATYQGDANYNASPTSPGVAHHVNIPPTVSNVAKTANEDVAVAFAAVDFTPGSYSDPEGVSLTTVRITSLPTNGVLKISGNTFTVPQNIAIGSIGNLTYTSNADYNGPDTFGWNGSDGVLFALSPATVNLTVNAVNDKPTLDAISNPAAISEDAPLQTINLAGISTGAANETQTLTVTATSANTAVIPHPTVGYTSANATGSIAYTPIANASGSSLITVTVTDNGATGGTNVNTFQRTFTATVNAVNDAPVITGQQLVSTSYNTARTIIFSDLTVTDPDNTYPTGFTLTAANGTNYTRSGNVITPALNFFGTLAVPVKVNDGTVDSNSINLAITVNPDPQTVKTGATITPLGGGYQISFIGNPGQQYTVQRTDDLTSTWITIGVSTANPSGNFSIIDTPNASVSRRFYRAIGP